MLEATCCELASSDVDVTADGASAGGADGSAPVDTAARRRRAECRVAPLTLVLAVAAVGVARDEARAHGFARGEAASVAAVAAVAAETAALNGTRARGVRGVDM